MTCHANGLPLTWLLGAAASAHWLAHCAGSGPRARHSLERLTSCVIRWSRKLDHPDDHLLGIGNSAFRKGVFSVTWDVPLTLSRVSDIYVCKGTHVLNA